MNRRGTSEADLQRAVVQALRFALPKTAIIHHCANEVTEAGPRGARRQAILVGMGVHGGFADLMVICAGRVLFLELKSLKGRLSPTQIEFRHGARLWLGTGAQSRRCAGRTCRSWVHFHWKPDCRRT